MIGSTSNIAITSKYGIKTGGTIDGIARLNVTRNKSTLSLSNPIGIELPEKSLQMSPELVPGVSLNYGVPISWLNYSATEQVFFADGIGHIKLYNNDGYAYNASTVAPKTELTATSAAASNLASPIASYGGSNTPCSTSPPFQLERVASYVLEGTGTEIIPSVLPDTIANTLPCDQYKAIDRTTTDDSGYINFTPRYDASSNIECYAQLRLGVPPSTPTVYSGHKIHLRLQYTTVGTPTDLNFVITLRTAAAPGAGTQIGTWTYDESDLTGSFASYTITLSNAEAALITDYTSLYLYMNCDSDPGTLADYYSVQCSLAYMEFPDSSGLPNGAYSYVYTYVRSSTGAESGRSPIAEIDHTTNGCINVHDILLSPDSTVDYINIYRTTRGGETYFLVKTIPNTNDSLVEYGEGTDITSQDPTEYADGFIDCMSDVVAGSKPRYLEGSKRVYGEGLPPKVRYLKSHLNRIFGAGAYISHPYVAGTAYATNNSTTIIGVGTHWTTELEGRSFKMASAPSTQVYTIAKVDSETSLELTTVFNESTTDGSYNIKDNYRNPYTLYWSRPGFPEDWPSANGLTIEGETGEGITGLSVLLGKIIIFTKDSMYALVGNDESSFSIQPIYKGVGCLSGHSIIESGNTIMFLDSDGWFLYNGGEPFPISSPDAQDGNVSGIDRTVNEIAKSRARMACGYYNDDSRTYHNFVSLNALENNHSIVYDSAMKSWSIDDVPGVFSCAPVFDEDDDKIYLLGTMDGCIFQADIGTSDGVYTGTIVAQVTSADSQIITCSAANFDTADGLTGCPAFLVDMWGNVTEFRILSNSATELNVLFPLRFIPDSTYTVVVGVVDLKATTGWVNFNSTHRPIVLQQIEVTHTPSFTGEILVRSAEGFKQLEYRDSVNLTNLDGMGKVFLRHKDRHFKIELRSFIPGHTISVNNISIYVLSEKED